VADALQSGDAPTAASGLAALSAAPDAASLLQQILDQVPSRDEVSTCDSCTRSGAGFGQTLLRVSHATPSDRPA